MNKKRIHILAVYAIFLFLLTIIQYSIPDSLSIFGAKPDLLFVFPVLVGYLYGTMDAVAIGLLAGFIRDAYSGRLIGLGMLVCILCGVIASVFLKKILSRNILLALVQVVFASFFYSLFLTTVSFLFFGVSLPLTDYAVWMARHQLVPAIIMNTVVAVVLYLSLRLFGPYKTRGMQKLSEAGGPDSAQW